ncbi:unnamed protein product [Phytophthora fragariaefolia]|uniref:Unnamed protein product n=1 Tax=Phytophthora fragariaefolia TaxID=1490495 RepID=A0A9W6TKV4_9STRA|nr:unnamed protein product [Phytophthora fragariaefolia]
MDLNPEVGEMDLGIRTCGETRPKGSRFGSRRLVDLNLIWWIWSLAAGSGLYNRMKRQAQERKTRKGKGHTTRQPRAGSRSRVLDPWHPDLNRKTTGSGHYTASSVRISTLVAKIPKSRQAIHSSTLGHFTSYQRIRSSPTDGYTR